MSMPTMVVVRDDSSMSSSKSPGPRSGGPTPRRTITPAQKLDYLAGYETAVKAGTGGAFLREQGIYSSQITEWRKLRDAGVLAGKRPGERIGKLTPEQVEIARLKRRIELTDQRLATTEVALEIMSKMHELLETLSKSSRDETPHTKP